jgi:disulfide bond formation protein DsbB
MTHRFGFWLANLSVFAVTCVLLGGFVVQFALSELPCPLCLLQRMCMMLAAMGPAFILMRAKHGDVNLADFATGYGLSIVAAMLGATISFRHILLHINDTVVTSSSPVLGLHLFSWALIVFCTAIVWSGLNLVFARELTPQQFSWSWPSRFVLSLFAVTIAANLVAVICLEGFHWLLPSDPERYQLFVDLGWR